MMPNPFQRVAAVLLAILPAHAADGPTPAQVQRAAAIVEKLELDEAAKSERVRDIIAGFYYELGMIHDERDRAADEADRQLSFRQQTDLHRALIGQLGAELTPAGVDAVKDGLTYHVVPNTYRAYLELLPDLSDEQRRRIHAWLLEAREHAIDAGSADAKHQIFRKYKGRITNYLSAQDIDLNEARRQAKPK